MTQNLSPQIARVLALSKAEARRTHQDKVGAVALLLGMLNDREGAALKVIEQFGISTDQLRNTLEAQIKPSIDEGSVATEGAEVARDVDRILRLAQLEARLQRENNATDVHLFLAMLRDKTNEGCKVLASFNLNYDNAMKFIAGDGKLRAGASPLASNTPDDEEAIPAGGEPRQEGRRGTDFVANNSTDKDTPILDSYGVDLTKAAADGALDPIVGRHDEIERMAQILTRRKKNNPILIGEPGVGKSALVEGLAQLIVQNKVPHLLTGKRLISLDMASIVALAMIIAAEVDGSLRLTSGPAIQHAGDLAAILSSLEEGDVLFIDEIHTIIGAGSAPGSLDAANILKPALARGEVQCIGATTISEFRKSIEKDGALDRRFQKIQLEPTTAEDTLQILNNIKERYEDHHNVIYTPAALSACVALTERYISDRALPDKAIDALDEAGSRVHLLNVRVPASMEAKEQEIQQLRKEKEDAAARQEYELAAGLRDRVLQGEAELKQLREDWQKELSEHRIVVDEDAIAAVVSMMSGVPADRMKESETVRLKGMKQALSEKVIAQDRAITRLTRAITRNRLGLKDPNRPIGTFMFVGPTGVGKTHLVKTLAEFMFGSKDALIRIDMSEYGEKFSTSRLVGAPPGYVGYEEGGQLTEKVRRHPYSIVLLDEIEKAHPDVFNMLLQVMDEGRMTDGNGTTVDFRNTILIMTSNSGSRQVKEFGAGVGFSASADGITAEAAEHIVRKALQRQFAPEFLNRLDEIVMFDPLTREGVEQIADLEIRALAQRLQTAGRQVSFSPEAKRFVAQKGFDPQYGARSLRRTLQEYVEDPLCDLLLEGENGESILVELDEANDRLKVRAVTTA